jgi:hypothetical protein
VHSRLPPTPRPVKLRIVGPWAGFRRIPPANDNDAARTNTLGASEVWHVVAFLYWSPDELRRRKLTATLRKARALCALCGQPVLAHKLEPHFGIARAYGEAYCAIGEPYMIGGC